MRHIFYTFILASSLVVTGCTTVPQEVVDLSALTAKDLRTLHNGYRSLVRKHFAAIRKSREQEFADKVLTPFITDAIKEGKLVEVAQGKLVWDSVKEKHVAPDPAKATSQKLDSLNTWNREVAEGIEDLRKKAFADLDNLEAEVLDEVDRSFSNVINSNITIQAYLLSLQDVEKAQSKLLSDIGIEDAQKKINDALAKASKKAEELQGKVNDANEKVNEIKSGVNQLKER